MGKIIRLLYYNWFRHICKIKYWKELRIHFPRPPSNCKTLVLVPPLAGVSRWAAPPFTPPRQPCRRPARQFADARSCGPDKEAQGQGEGPWRNGLCLPRPMAHAGPKTMPHCRWRAGDPWRGGPRHIHIYIYIYLFIYLLIYLFCLFIYIYIYVLHIRLSSYGTSTYTL